ncbi:MAG TPA: prepilin-type N-terminal cleavage/methylation domain-containing protein, partial [Polyangiaceae bacterium]|nr:prepilin-type N-terminal cleavage/methylation domain-containing protein [Polyangiaceae bacterium]
MSTGFLASCASKPKLVVARRASLGFTLMELMIVVVIMGVLASLAVYSLNGYLQRAKVSEAREVVGQIMAAQEAYFDEVGSYLDVTGGMNDDNFYPAGNFDGRIMIQWGGVDAC